MCIFDDQRKSVREAENNTIRHTSSKIPPLLMLSTPLCTVCWTFHPRSCNYLVDTGRDMQGKRDCAMGIWFLSPVRISN